LDKNGSPQQKYISRLTDEDAHNLLNEVSLEIPGTDFEVLPSRPNENRRSEETVALALVRIRREQRYLRQHLLDGRSEAECAICRDTLPQALLVAGHIKRRSECTEDERWAFKRVAMLVCTLGCDALFEAGFIEVDDAGVVRAGHDGSTDAVRAAVLSLTGLECGAFNAKTRDAFAAHRDYHATRVANIVTA
jgi:hypothetical protein